LGGERQVDVVAFVQLRDDHLDVLLPRAASKNYLRLRIARKCSDGPPRESGDRGADAVFVGARLGLDRERDRGSEDAAAEWIGAALSPSVSPVSVSFVSRLRPGPRRAIRLPPFAFSLHHLPCAGARSCRA